MCATTSVNLNLSKSQHDCSSEAMKCDMLLKAH